MRSVEPSLWSGDWNSAYVNLHPIRAKHLVPVAHSRIRRRRGGEQEGMRNLFAGAMAVYKNPPSHRDVDFDSPERVIYALTLASELLTIVERRRGD